MQSPALGHDVHQFLKRFRLRPQRAWDDDPAVADAAVGRVMVLGDIHNSRPVFEAAARAAIEERCDVLVQVGDFGLQDCSLRGYSTSEATLMWAAAHSPIPVVVVDGNHEMWPCLVNLLNRHDTLVARQRGRPLHLAGSLWWADRGSVWTWSGRRFGALGGSVSPDRQDPYVEVYRWPEEATTRADLGRLIDNAPEGLDVLLCHDAPADTQGLVGSLRMPENLRSEAAVVRDLLQAAVDATAPELVVHGHWHKQNRCRINGGATEVVGLAADGRPGCGAVLSLNALQAAQAAYTDICD